MITDTNSRKWIGLALAGVVATGFAAVDLGMAAAVTKTINSTCTTQVGNQAMTATFTVNAPANAKVGQPVAATVTFNGVIPAAQGKQLAQIAGADGLDYSAVFHDMMTGAATGDAMGTVAVKGVALSANADTKFSGTITFANLKPTAAGTMTLTAGNVDTMITPTKGGAATNLGTVAVPCTVNAGQDVNLFTVTVA